MSTVPPALPAPPAHIHFVGIGGIGMSGLARMLQSKGYRVTGTDATASELTAQLAAEGIPVSVGHDDVVQASLADLVVHTAAVDDANPEIAAATARGTAVIKRAQLLGVMAATGRCIAVAGTHGKSTTSAMLTTALIELGFDPSYAVGAVLQTTQTNAALGSGDAFVVEADEYDRSFLALRPDRAIITNVEYDHPDIFSTMDDYVQAFVDFASQLAPDGSLVASGDDPGAGNVLDHLDASIRARMQTFGLTRGLDWTLSGEGGAWRMQPPAGDPVDFRLQVPGAHNAINAVAAIATMAGMGIEPRDAAKAIESYRGIGRRFETKGRACGVLVIDDYAHHPTEIQATLRAAIERFPGRRIWAVFQPHTYSRTSALLEDFERALRIVEHRVVLDVYGARERNEGSVTDDDMQRLAGEGSYRAADPAAACELLCNLVKPGDVVLTLGAGDVTSIGPALLDRLEQECPDS